MRRLFEDLERLSFGTQARVATLRCSFRPSTSRVAATARGARDLPGLAPEEVRLSVDERRVGHRRRAQVRARVSEGDVWRAERTYGKFHRVIPLPENADTIRSRRASTAACSRLRRAPEQKKGKQIDIRPGHKTQSRGQPSH